MSIAKVKNSSVLNGMKLEEGNDSITTLVRQAIGTEPFLSFPRSADNSIPWFQFLNSLDNQDLPGWPLLSPIKLPMQKCDKCSREFFSTINFRRHVRVHHRVKKLDKDTAKNRNLLAAFWDKLSMDEAKEILSLQSSMVEDVPGDEVINSLTSLICKPGVPSSPQVCLRAGSALLDIIQERPSRFPLSSEELFSILDDASEKTFLSGPTNSIQKYIFDGEAGKIGLENKNVVAFTCFLLEQKLVKAWIANKDAEALRCQELLVEEEEAAQKRQAHILERKRQKKLRQKELKAKHRNGNKVSNNDGFDTAEAELLAGMHGFPDASDSDVDNLDAPLNNVLLLHKKPDLSDTQKEADSASQSGVGSSDAYQTVEPSSRHAEDSHQHPVSGSWHASRKAWAVSNSSHEHQNTLKHKYGNRGLRPAYMVNGKKVWSRKPKPETEELDLKFRVQEEFSRADQDKKHEVLIGSIAVTLGSCGNQHEIDYVGAHENSSVGYRVQGYSSHEKPKNVDAFLSGTNQPRQKLWRPVSRHETEDSLHVQTVHREAEVYASQIENNDGATTVDGNNIRMECKTLLTDVEGLGATQLSSHAAKEFLAQRWKEAISGEHIKLVIYQEPEVPASSETENDRKASPDVGGNDENRVVNGNFHNALPTGTAKFKLKTKQEKGFKKKYIIKQRVNT